MCLQAYTESNVSWLAQQPANHPTLAGSSGPAPGLPPSWLGVWPLAQVPSHATVAALGHLSGHLTGHMSPAAATPATRPQPGLLFAQLAGRLPPAAAGLHTALATSLRRWDAGTQGRMLDVMRLFSASMSHYPNGADSCFTWATPNHILEFLEGWAYTGGKTLSKKKSHSTISTTLCHLSNLFKLYGRVAPWNPETGQGNPVDSMEIQCYTRGFPKETARENAGSKGAVPWSYEKLSALLSCLDQDQPTSPYSHSIQARDAAALCLAAAIGKRGEDVGQLWQGDFQTIVGLGLTPANYHPREGDGFQLLMFSKTRKEAPGAPLYFSYTEQPGQRECNFPWRLKQFWSTLSPGFQLGRYIFGNQGKALSADCLNERLKLYFPKYHLGPPLKVHGLRRGLSQTLEEAGFERSAIMQHMDIVSSRAYNLYRDTIRHLPLDDPIRVSALQFGNLQRAQAVPTSVPNDDGSFQPPGRPLLASPALLHSWARAAQPPAPPSSQSG